MDLRDAGEIVLGCKKEFMSVVLTTLTIKKINIFVDLLVRSNIQLFIGSSR